MTVVGVVADERHNSVTGIVNEKFFIPHVQWRVVTQSGDPIRSVFIVARTTGDPMSVAGAIRGEIRQMDASLPVSNVRSMNEVVATALATPRLTGFLLERVCGDRIGARRGRHLRRPRVRRVTEDAARSVSGWPSAPIGRRCSAWCCGKDFCSRASASPPG